MEVTLAALADSANVSGGGKLNILGAWDTLHATEFPTTHPAMSFAFRLKAEHEDKNTQQALQVNLLDEDFRVLWGASATIQVGEIQPGEFTQIPHVVNLVGTRFEKPGRYRLRIRIEGIERPFDTVFQVVKAQPRE